MHPRGCRALEIVDNPPAPLPALTTMELEGVQLPSEDMSLQMFPGLRRLVLHECGGDDKVKLDLSRTPKLQHLSITDMSKVQLQLAGAPDLAHLTCTYAGMKTLDLGLPDGEPRTALKHLDLSCCRKLESLDLFSAPNLTHLACGGCSSLVLHTAAAPWCVRHADGAAASHTGPIALCSHTTVSEPGSVPGFRGGATVEACTALQELHWEACPRESLDLTAMSQLRVVDVPEGNFTALDQLPSSV